MCWTGKKFYPNGASAMREARKLKRGNRGSHALRAYHCPDCGGYHLTNDRNRRSVDVGSRWYREVRESYQREG